MAKPKIIPSQNYLNLVERVRQLDKRSANWMLAQKTLRHAHHEDYVEPLELENVFVWLNTPQGHTHWQQLNRRLKG